MFKLLHNTKPYKHHIQSYALMLQCIFTLNSSSQWFSPKSAPLLIKPIQDNFLTFNKSPLSLRKNINIHRRNFSSAQEVPIFNNLKGLFNENFEKKLNYNLHLKYNHPIGIIKSTLDHYFLEILPIQFPTLQCKQKFKVFNNFPIVLPIKQNFDDLLISSDHISRSPSETFYVDTRHVIRSQATAHQPELLKSGEKAAVWSAIVARKDEIDKFHYPIFHQYDGLQIFHQKYPVPISDLMNIFRPHWNLKINNKYIDNNTILHLQCTLEGLIDYLFGESKPRRWDYNVSFPFTHPSLELEIYHNEQWIEILGSGSIHRAILDNCSLTDFDGWAFGIGIDRLTMILFQIPDIRILWSEDERFHQQFLDGKIKSFKPFSKHPGVYKDVTFWINPGFQQNHLYQLFREHGGDILESVKVIDEYQDPNTKMVSKCFRLIYRSLDRNLTNEEVNTLHRALVKIAVESFSIIER